jgi:hypothetical protein
MCVGALVLAIVLLAGCASRGTVRVGRTPWGAEPIPEESAPPAVPSASPSDTETFGNSPRVADHAARAGASPARASTQIDEPAQAESLSVDLSTKPPVDAGGTDPFDTMFVGAGKVEEVSEAEILAEARHDLSADTTTRRALPPSRTSAERVARGSEGPSGPASPAQGTPGAATNRSPRPADSVSPVLAPSATRGPTPPGAIPDSTPASGRISENQGYSVNGRGASTTTPSDTQTTGYSVQLLAFPTRAAAEFGARQASRTLGTDAWVAEVRPASFPFKVVAGRALTHAAAESLRVQAVANGFPEAFVVATPRPVQER